MRGTPGRAASSPSAAAVESKIVQGLYFALEILAVAIVIWWCVRSETKGGDYPYRGLLAMKQPALQAQETKPNVRKRASPPRPSARRV